MKVHTNHALLDIIILGDTKQDTVNIMTDLMKVCKHMGLLVNQKKTKYMLMTRDVPTIEDELDLEVDRMSFSQVHDFKYLKVDVNNRTWFIKLHLKVRNVCYFAILVQVKIVVKEN